MEASPEHQKAHNEVLRLIGRNVLLFQHIEHLLKSIVARKKLEGTAEDLEQILGEWLTPDKRTLGGLVVPLIENHLTPIDPEALIVGRADQVAFSFTTTIELPPEERSALHRALDLLVAQRNELIHQSLHHLDLKTIEGCKEATAKLEKQRNEIEPVRNKLIGFAEATRSATKGLLSTVREHADKFFPPRT